MDPPNLVAVYLWVPAAGNVQPTCLALVGFQSILLATVENRMLHSTDFLGLMPQGDSSVLKKGMEKRKGRRNNTINYRAFWCIIWQLRSWGGGGEHVSLNNVQKEDYCLGVTFLKLLFFPDGWIRARKEKLWSCFLAAVCVSVCICMSSDEGRAWSRQLHNHRRKSISNWLLFRDRTNVARCYQSQS